MSTTDTLPPETPAEAKSGGGVVLQRLVGRHCRATLYNDSAENLVRKLEGVDMGLNPGEEGLVQGGLGEGVVAGTQGGHKEISFPSFSG